MPVAVVAALLVAAPAAHAAGQVTTFASTQVEQTYTVLAGTSQIHVEAIGAAGGGFAGGAGARVVADLAVTPGQILYVEVGGQPSIAVGGWNGGGDGSSGTGGGGGASDIRLTSGGGNLLLPASLASRVLVAGGGGGMSFITNFGGSAGASPTAGQGTLPGQPGTASAGGAGGGGAGSAGTAGQGGNGTTGGPGGSGGGGGGGLFGGGGGSSDATSDGGGGAGSSFATPAATGVSISAVVGFGGPGSVTITTAPTTVVADGPVAFGGGHPVGTVTTRQLVLRNTGLGPFAFTGSPTVSGDAEQDFIVSTPNCNGFVASCRIAVLFAPSATGQRTATLTVPTTDDAGPIEVPLSGTATAAAEPAPSITNVTYAAAPVPAAPATTTTTPTADMVLATCHVGSSQGHPALRCRVVKVPAGAKLPGSKLLTATLANRSARYATGTARVADGVTQLLLTPTRRITSGRYSTLTLKKANGSMQRTAIVIS